MAAARLLAGLAFSTLLLGQIAVFPLSQVKRGQVGVGKTVFQGDKVEDFRVEILGVIENLGPKQSVILARLSGGPLERTGVMQGMSGSPVYIDGKLLGAVALTFAFSKEPIAGIRPIREMLDIESAPARPLRPVPPGTPGPAAGNASPVAAAGLGANLIEIATPLAFGGFTSATLDHFGPNLRNLGLSPVQGNTGGGNPDPVMGDPKLVQPGTMLSVQLMSGDMSVSAEGTVTAVDGERVYAFGHRFLEGGPSALPFARAEVLALMPNVSTSFKISAAREWMGTITQDRSVGIAGLLGTRPRLIPLSVTVNAPAKPGPAKAIQYRMRMVDDRTLTPLLVQMATFSAIDATERTTGSSLLRVRGVVEFAGAPPVKIDNVYSGDFSVAAQASLGTATPVSYAIQSGFDELRVKNAQITIDVQDRRQTLQIDQVTSSGREARPGESVEIAAVLNGENGAEVARKVRYEIPVGASPGTLYFTVSDAASANLSEYQQWLGSSPRTARQIVDFLNDLRPSNKMYVRVWRQDPSYQVNGQDLPDLPASASMLYAREQSASGTATLGRGSKVTEFAIDTGESVVTGSKTTQVEIKE